MVDGGIWAHTLRLRPALPTLPSTNSDLLMLVVSLSITPSLLESCAGGRGRC